MSCSTRLAYTYADWWLEWQVEDLVELNDEQEDKLSALIDDFFTWHKNNELPEYAQLLRDFDHAIEKQNTSLFLKKYQELPLVWQRSSAYIAPKLIGLMDELTQQQKLELVENLELKQQEQHEKWQEEAEQETNEDRMERRVENLERWLGHVTPEQLESFTSLMAKTKPTMQDRIEARQQWLVAFETALISKPMDEMELRRLITDINYKRTKAHQDKSDFNRELFQNWFAQQLGQLSQEQRDNVSDEIADYLADIDYLAAR
ncbi:MAG: hypothetical protein HWE10_10385 [Gammaproteobacteria bacterium]|nr:hypothetical protein [Gammaproteobacteria bacterium]